MEKIKLWIWLDYIKGIGKKTKYNLYNYFGDIYTLYNAQKEDYKKSGIKLSKEVIEQLCNKNIDLDDILDSFEKLNIKPVSIDMQEYPDLLRKTGDSPVVIYCRGSFINLNNKMCVSVVGSRKLSLYGKTHGYNIAKQMAKKGAVVVSGMAYGIDTMAHLGALDAQMPTVAVLGCGPDVVYPVSNKKLMERIMQTGMIISEYPLGTEAQNYTFPERNKIIAGISVATVVVEANLKSGSLITADLAKKYNRKVFAVPGSIETDYSKGTNMLIKNGAGLVTCGDDIINSFSECEKMLLKKQVINNEEKSHNLSSVDEKIIKSLTNEPVSIDILSEKSGIDIVTLNSKLLLLEIQGKIAKHPGNRYSIEGRILN